MAAIRPWHPIIFIRLHSSYCAADTNQLSGPLPERLPPSLIEMDLNRNQLTGTVSWLRGRPRRCPPWPLGSCIVCLLRFLC